MTSFGYVIPAFGPFADAGAMTELVDIGEELGFDDVWYGDWEVGDTKVEYNQRVPTRGVATGPITRSHS